MNLEDIYYDFPEVQTAEEKEDFEYDPRPGDRPAWYSDVVTELSFTSVPDAEHRAAFEKRPVAMGLTRPQIEELAALSKSAQLCRPARRRLFSSLRQSMLRQLISTSGAGNTAELCDVLLTELSRGEPAPVPAWYDFAPYNASGPRKVGYACCASRGCFNTEGPAARPFPKCAKCQMAVYCCRACQIRDWGERHKVVCKAARRSRELVTRTARSIEAMALGRVGGPDGPATMPGARAVVSALHPDDPQLQELRLRELNAAFNAGPAVDLELDLEEEDDDAIFAMQKRVIQNMQNPELLRQTMANPELLQQVMASLGVQLPNDLQLQREIVAAMALRVAAGAASTVGLGSYPPFAGGVEDYYPHGHSHGGVPCHGHGEPATHAHHAYHSPPAHAHMHGHSHGGVPCDGHYMDGEDGGDLDDAEDGAEDDAEDDDDDEYLERLHHLVQRRKELEGRLSGLENEREALQGRENKNRRQKIAKKIQKLEKEFIAVEEELEGFDTEDYEEAEAEAEAEAAAAVERATAAAAAATAAAAAGGAAATAAPPPPPADAADSTAGGAMNVK